MIGSLFSGIGGLELGLEWAGLGPTTWQVELDPYCREVLRKHWPTAERFADVRELHGGNLPAVPVWCGGFPCQDLSSANPGGAGLAGARSGLWFEYHRLLAEAQAAGRGPVGVVVENVGRLAIRGLDTVASGLHDLGYSVEATRILAADVGAPHRRERIFLVAVADRDLRGREKLGVAEHPWLGSPRGYEPDGCAPRGWRDGTRHLDAEPPEPGLGRAFHGVPVRVDDARPGNVRPAPTAHAWPAPRGASQHDWEPPRTRRISPGRADRLKALGNAVVPQVAYVVGLRLRERLPLPCSLGEVTK